MKAISFFQLLSPLILLTLLTGTTLPGTAAEVDYSSELTRTAPMPVDQAIDSFDVGDGFEMQLVASEPLIGSPVAIAWDATGSMFVCEMRGYSEDREDAISGIARLTDSDGDGVYDQRTQYATNLFWPTGIFPYDGGLFVGDAPDLWYFKDVDEDGVADVKQRVLTGFGTSNVQGLMNSFRWGLDNRVHIACSSVGGEIRHARASSNRESTSIHGRDLALNPRTHAFAPTSGAAQHGMCFDDWGNKFVSSNSDHIQQVMYEDHYVAANPFALPPPSRLSIAADGPQAEVFRQSPVEPWRILRTRLRVSGQASGPIEGGGRAAGYFTGATGVTIYRGDAWPSQWKGTALIGDVGSNLIHRKRLQRKGVVFEAHRIDDRREFVASTDQWFRPAQFANAPDGTIYVIDMYREVIEHPKSLPAEIKKHLDLTSGRDRGRIYRIVPRGFTTEPVSNRKGATTAQLVEILAHENAWHRETAARLLYERQDPSAVPLLKTTAQHHSSPLARMHALYALAGNAEASSDEHAGLRDVATLLAGLNDPHAQVRKHALRLSESMVHDKRIAFQIQRLADDRSTEVLYQLAFSAAVLPKPDRVQILSKLILKYYQNQWIRAAILVSVGDAAGELKTQLMRKHSLPSRFSEDVLGPLERQIAARERLGHQAVSEPRETSRVVRRIQSPTRSVEASKAREAVVARYQPSLTMAADPERGRRHFKKNCAICHQLGNAGYALGPNLAASASRGAESLLTSILDPNREVNPLYYNHVLLTVDGKIQSGMIVDEGATSVTVRNSDEASVSVLRLEIEELKNTGLSLMPEGFEDSMDRQAMADLIAFLMNQGK